MVVSGIANRGFGSQWPKSPVDVRIRNLLALFHVYDLSTLIVAAIRTHAVRHHRRMTVGAIRQLRRSDRIVCTASIASSFADLSFWQRSHFSLLRINPQPLAGRATVTALTTWGLSSHSHRHCRLSSSESNPSTSACVRSDWDIHRILPSCSLGPSATPTKYPVAPLQKYPKCDARQSAVPRSSSVFRTAFILLGADVPTGLDFSQRVKTLLHLETHRQDNRRQTAVA